MAGIKKRLGTLLGPQGRTPQLTVGTTEQVAAGEPAEVTLVKTGTAAYRVDARIPKGIDGDPSGVADLDDASSSLVNTQGTKLQTALNTQSAEVMAPVRSEAGSAVGVAVSGLSAAKGRARDIATHWGFGSSTMDRIVSEMQSALAPYGATWVDAGQGGEIAEQTTARIGSRPVQVDAVTIPSTGFGESNPLPITVQGMVESPNTGVTISGKLGGVHGTLKGGLRSNPVYTFARTTVGPEVRISAGTPFIPDREARAGVLHLNLGKNNLTAHGGTQDVQALLGWLRDAVALHDSNDYVIWGHFVDTNTPATSATRDRILAMNQDMRAEFGEHYFDQSAYLTGAQVWMDTGITPTASDVEQQALGNKPPSLSSDDLHLNNAADSAVASRVVRHLLERGMLPSLDVDTPPAFRWNADNIPGAHLASITSWKNTGTAAGGDMTSFSTNPPDIMTAQNSGINGHRAALFTYTDQNWAETGAISGMEGPMTVVLVARYASEGGNTQRIFGAGGANDYLTVLMSGGSVAAQSAVGGVLTSLTGPALAASQFTVIVAVFNGAASSVTVNGQTTTGNLGPALPSLTPARFGTNASRSTHYFYGRLGLCEVHKRAFNAAEVAAMTARLRADYMV